MPSHEDVKTPIIALVGFLGALVTFALVVFLTVVFYWVEADLRRERYVEQPWEDLERTVASQRARLVEYRWVDRRNGTVAVPIDRAMELVVREMQVGRGPSRAEDRTGEVPSVGGAASGGRRPSPSTSIAPKERPDAP